MIPRPAPLAGTRRPRVPDRALWVNGELVRGEAAHLSLFDRGARDGEGLMETLRLTGGQPLHWDLHLERLVLSAAELGFPVPPSPSQLRHGLARLLAEEGLSDAIARITVTRGVMGGRPVRAGSWIEVAPLAARLWSGTRRQDARAIVSKRAFAPGPLGPHKTTSRLAYHLAREEARAADADEALLVAADGQVLEGATSNVFVVRGGEAVTPPLGAGILPGITRRIVLERCRALGIAAREARVDRSELEAADEIFVTNAAQWVVPLERLDGRSLPSRSVGTRLADDYRRLAGA